MGKLKNIFTNQKELPKWILPLVILVWLYMIITEYGHRPFVEGFMEDFTDPVLYYIFIGVGIVFVIVYFVKRNEKNKVEDGELDNSIQEENSSNGGMTIVVIVWIFVMILGYFSNRHSKETEKRVEDFIEQKKMEQIDLDSQ